MKVVECLYNNREKKKIALRFGDISISYRDLWAKSVELSKKLSDNNETKIGIILPNSIEYVIAYFAILISGKTIVAINSMLNEQEIKNIIEFCEIKTVFGKLSKDDFSEINMISEIDCELDEAFDYYNYGYKFSDDDVALIVPTSGTTSKPKYVPLTNENLCSNVLEIMRIYHMSAEINQEENELIVLPLTSAFCNTTQLLVCLTCAMTITIFEGRFNLSKFFQTISNNNIQYCEMTPSLLKIFSQTYSSCKFDVSCFKRVSYGSEPITNEEILEIRKLMPNVHILFGYGMTEASPVIATQLVEDYREAGNSVGKPLGNFSVKIIDFEGKELSYNEDGEILVKGPSVMKGYYKGENSVIDGWLHTGDIGHMDENGYLYITGRRKNIIITAGRNVCAEEVEAALNICDCVKESKVYGEKDDSFGEIVCAQIVLKEGKEFNRESIIHECNGKIAGYKIPKKYVVVESIPRNTNGKIVRN